jgi:NADPH2:quinone reductase
MKAVVVENYDSIDGISIKEIEMPGISAGEVRVKIGAAAVGFVDGLKVQGLYRPGPAALVPARNSLVSSTLQPTTSPRSSRACP